MGAASAQSGICLSEPKEPSSNSSDTARGISLPRKSTSYRVRETRAGLWRLAVETVTASQLMALGASHCRSQLLTVLKNPMVPVRHREPRVGPTPIGFSMSDVLGRTFDAKIATLAASDDRAGANETLAIIAQFFKPQSKAVKSCHACVG